MGIVARIESKVDATLCHANQAIAEGRDTITRGNALINDVRDGFALRAKLDSDFVKRLVGAVQAAMLGGPATDIPLTLMVDLEFDTRSGATGRFVGGPYDGKSYLIPQHGIESGEMTLTGGAKYKWNGYAFEYQGA